jgi:hypothetical protein
MRSGPAASASTPCGIVTDGYTSTRYARMRCVRDVRGETVVTEAPRSTPLNLTPGGFALGADSRSIRTTCVGAGQQFTPMHGAPSARCTGLAKPVELDVQSVVVEFCDDRLCHVALEGRPALIGVTPVWWTPTGFRAIGVDLLPGKWTRHGTKFS